MAKIPNPYELGKNLIKSQTKDAEMPEPAELNYRGNKEDALRLTGLNRHYNRFAAENIDQYLISQERKKAYENIKTNTFPIKERIKQKQGIISEMIKSSIIPEEILIKYPAIYLGSDIDIEYPLALGCRKIIMVDSVLESPELCLQLAKKIEYLTGQEAKTSENKIVFQFDFGKGGEEVTIKIEPYLYEPDTDKPNKFIPPEEIGLILSFALQDPRGHTEIKGNLKDNLIDNGLILNDDNILKRKKSINDWEEIKLGHE